MSSRDSSQLGTIGISFPADAMTSGGLRLLQDLRRTLLELPRQLWPHAVTQAPAAEQPGTAATVA